MKKYIHIQINNLLILLKRLSFLLILLLCILGLDVQEAFAHRPHDVIEQVQISPSYDQDKTLFIIVRGNLFKSREGGSSWQRLVTGLDNTTTLASVSISPQTNKTLFLSTLGDGIYKSQDQGVSWSNVNNGLDTLKINLLSISPHSNDVVLAAGQEKSLYKTKDGGKNWSKVIDSQNPITVIGFSPDNKDQIVVGDVQGNLIISNNEGEDWQPASTLKNNGAITAIALSPNFSSDQTVFVGTENGGIFKSADKGSSFQEINKGLADKLIRSLVIVENSDNNFTLVASTANEGVFQSTDGGNTWTKTSQGLTKDTQADEEGFKQPHFSDLAISPSFGNDQTMFLGGFNGLFKSTDGGQLWQEIETLSSRTIISMAVSPNYQNDSTLAFATYVGEMYISKDKGVTWELIINGLEIPRFTKNFKEPHQDPRRFFDIAFSPNYGSDKKIFATVLWDNFLKSNNSGNRWDIVPLKTIPGRGTRGIAIAPSPTFASDKTVYLGTQYGIIYKSTDGGASFSNIGDVGNRKLNAGISLVISPDFSSDQTLYALGPKGVHKTVDGGKTWQPTTEGTALAQTNLIQLAISPNYQADQTVFVGTGSGIFQTQDGGKTWSKLVGDAYGRDAYIEGIAISPNYKNDQTLMISVKGQGLFKTVNRGETFSPIGEDFTKQNNLLARMDSVPSAGVPIHFSPSYAVDKTIYGFGSSTAEVFKSTDGGNSWEVLKISRQENKIGLLTSISLMFIVYPRLFIVYPRLKLVIPVIAALLSYWVLGYLNLEKKLPLSKLQIKAGGALVTFVLVVILLYI